STNPNNLTSLEDLQRYTQTTPAEAWPDRNTATWDATLARNISTGNASPEFWAAYQQNLYFGGPGGIDGALASMGVEGGLDALVLPTDFAAGIAAIVGYPVVTVPMGFYPLDWPVVRNARGTLVTLAPNMPFGLAFIGRPFSEE